LPPFLAAGKSSEPGLQSRTVIRPHDENQPWLRIVAILSQIAWKRHLDAVAARVDSTVACGVTSIPAGSLSLFCTCESCWERILSDVSDQTLIEQLRSGDRSAFALVIEKNQRSIYGYLRARLQQATDADDMTQEVFLRFYLAQARFDSTALIRPWLLGIARNLLREHVRDFQRRKEVAWSELCLELESVLPPDALWSDTDDVINTLPGCLEELGPSARQAIDLHYRSQRKLAEIGKEMHRSEGAVKLLMHRARQALRDCLLRRSPRPV
jgi:RNA polymerase sigma-70 factor (ECF subfamily)